MCSDTAIMSSMTIRSHEPYKKTIPVSKIETAGHSFLDGPLSHITEIDATISLGGEYVMIDFPNTCMNCGAYLSLRYDEDSGILRVNNDPCEAAGDIITTVRLNVPSGQLIVSDSLRSVYDVERGEVSLSSRLGQSTMMKLMEKAGCAYSCVITRDPDILRRPDGSYAIAKLPYNEEIDEDDVPEGWQPLAHIITSLWAVSIADYADWLAKGGETIEQNDDYGQRKLIDVEPGEYEFTVFTGRADFPDEHMSDDILIYTEFRRVGDATASEDPSE